MLPPGQDDPIRLPGTAALVWDRLAQPTPVEAIAGDLADLFGEEVADVEAGVISVVQDLLSRGAVIERR